jgi:hypothetical protein
VRKPPKLRERDSGSILAELTAMPSRRQESARDPAVLAQLHAAFDRMLEAEAALRAVRDAGYAQPTVRRIAQLVNESRALLTGLLAPEQHAAVGSR